MLFPPLTGEQVATRTGNLSHANVAAQSLKPAYQGRIRPSSQSDESRPAQRKTPRIQEGVISYSEKTADIMKR
jgi:hypothetical protein